MIGGRPVQDVAIREPALVGTQQRVLVVPGTLAAKLYGDEAPIEDYRCDYGVDAAYHAAFEQSGLRLSGRVRRRR
jgi:CTP synthase (UTP-ammonia lyase)